MNVLSWATSSLTNLVDFKQPGSAGAIDVIVVKQPNGTLCCTPFHVKFPKAQSQDARGRRVKIKIDGREIKLSMKLGQAGEAFFVEPTDGPVARELLSSPLPRREHRKQTSGSDQEESKLGSPTAALTAANLAQRSRSFSATRKDEPIASKEPEHDLHSLQQPVLGRRRSQSVGELKQSEPTVTTTTTVQSPQHVRAEPVNHWWSWKWGSLPVLKDREEEETGGNQLERVDSLAASDVADAVDQSKPAYLHSNGIAMSLCADVLATIGADAATMERVFVDNIVSREAFDHSRFAITDDQRLVVCIAGVLLPWKLAASLLLARTAFQIELTKALVQQWAADYRETQSGPVPNWFALELTGGELRSDSPSVASALVESEQKPASGNNGESIQIAVPISPAESVTNDQESLSGYPISPHSPLLSDADPNNSSRLLSVDEDKPVGDEQRLGELRIDVQSDTASEAEDEEEEEELLVHDIPLDEISPEPARGFDSDTESVTGSIDGDGGKKYRYRKTLVPSSEMLQGMGLRHGSNEIEFVLDGANTSVTARIFLWPSDAKVIVTDVDGPIVTRSNMLANFIPVKSRYHAGVVELFSNIQQNGYHILYLATKSLTQISSTKGELENVSHKDTRLPLGPVFLPPDSLFQTFGEERADVFKSVVLRGVRNLFPSDHNPFFAGFGTKASDMVAFKRVGFPDGRIFLVKDKGQVHNLNRTFNKTYTNLNDLLHEIFPAYADSFNENHHSFYTNRDRTEDAYNDVNYWRIPPPQLPVKSLRK